MRGRSITSVSNKGEEEETNGYGILGSKSLSNLSLVQDNAKPHPCSLELIRRQSSMQFTSNSTSSDNNPTIPTRKDDNEKNPNTPEDDSNMICAERIGEQVVEEREERCVNIRVIQRRPCRWSSSSSSSSTTLNQSSLSSSTKTSTNRKGYTSDYLPKYPERRYPDHEMLVSSFDTTAPTSIVGSKQNNSSPEHRHIESVLNVISSTEKEETS